ncbi:MAG TPA: FkbM family methyltransferase [Thermoanaerobaculia bacterium]|nr:FkbM family methyltransferase [Thermoanaerobaculia bacterium]
MGWLARLVRAPFRMVPGDRPLRILSGPLRGAAWLPRSAPHGCWLGIYERATQRLFSRQIAAGDVVFDVGAHVGFYSLLASRLVGPAGRVVAFEPLARNLELIERHLAYNGASNVMVVKAAVGERTGQERFDGSGEPSMGALAAEGDLVDLVCIDDLVGAGKIQPPQLMKIDVEGAESRVLQGAAATLAKYRPAILLAAHGWAQWSECSRRLSALGYSLRLLRDGSADGNYSLFATGASA